MHHSCLLSLHIIHICYHYILSLYIIYMTTEIEFECDNAVDVKNEISTNNLLTALLAKAIARACA